MKITIDTKEDSHEDIKKIVKMLEALLEGHVSAPLNMFGDANSGSAGSTETDLFSLFNDDKASQSSSTNEVKKDENKDDAPQIIVY